MVFNIFKRKKKELSTYEEQKIKPVQTDKGLLYEIEGMQGLYEVKDYDNLNKKYVFKRVK